MTAFLGAGYQPESREARTLGSFSADKFAYQDQQKNLIQLNNAVGYMSGYMRKMQKGIDDANKNFIQQIQGLISEIFVLFAGGGDTGFDFGDLRYIFQAIGALFGFGNGILPINLFQAAWHFVSNYVFPTDNFHDLINLIIDGAIASILDIFGEVPILGQALQQLAVIISAIRDALGPLIDFIDAVFSGFGGFDIGDPVGSVFAFFNNFWSFFDFLPFGSGGFDLIGAASTFINNILNPVKNLILNPGAAIVSFADGLIGVVNSIFGGIFGILQPGQQATSGQVGDAIGGQTQSMANLASEIAKLKILLADPDLVTAYEDFEDQTIEQISAKFDIVKEGGTDPVNPRLTTDGHQLGTIPAGAASTNWQLRYIGDNAIAPVDRMEVEVYLGDIGIPVPGPNQVPASIDIMGRWHSTLKTFVCLRLYCGSFILYGVKNNNWQVIGSQSIPIPGSGSSVKLRCGTDLGSKYFQVVINGQAYNFFDGANVSEVGAAFRGRGLGFVNGTESFWFNSYQIGTGNVGLWTSTSLAA